LKNKFKIHETRATHFANMQHHRKQYVTHSCSLLIFSISALLSKYKDNIGGKLKLLNCIQQKFDNPCSRHKVTEVTNFKYSTTLSQSEHNGSCTLHLTRCINIYYYTCTTGQHGYITFPAHIFSTMRAIPTCSHTQLLLGTFLSHLAVTFQWSMSSIWYSHLSLTILLLFTVWKNNLQSFHILNIKICYNFN
jgi:hypothetical protein